MDTTPVQHSQDFLNERKMAMALPLFIVPFLAVMFYLLGGGTPPASATRQVSGLNTEVPKPAANGHVIRDKLSAYKLKAKQEAEAERMRTLDDYSGSPVSAGGLDVRPVESGASGWYTPAAGSTVRREARREYDNLNSRVNSFYRTPANGASVSEAKLDRLIQLMEREQGGGTISRDVNHELKNHPYLQYLQRTLTSGQFAGEKPEPPVQDTAAKKQPERKMVEVAGYKPAVVNKLPQSEEGTPRPARQSGNAFYSLGGQGEHRTGNTISAMIHDDQTLVNGSTVKLRLVHDINLAGTVIPENSFIYGVASIGNERLNIAIANIRYGKDILPVDLKVYDYDGLPGVSIPGSIERDAGKEALGSMASGGSYQVTMATGVKEQLTMQAAQSGINGIKSLAGKKARQVKVHVKANYRVYLKS